MMAGATTRQFDVADHLYSPEEVAAYLDAVLEEGDDKLLLVALRNVVKSRGFAKVAQGTLAEHKVSRHQIHTSARRYPYRLVSRTNCRQAVISRSGFTSGATSAQWPARLS